MRRTALVFLSVFVLYFVGRAQTGITIITSVEDTTKFDKVAILDLSQSEFHDTTFQDSLIFKFSKNNVDCYNLQYHFNDKRLTAQFWLDANDVTIKSKISNSAIVVDTVINSSKFYEVKEFASNYSKLYAKKDTAVLNAFLLDSYQNNIKNPFSLAIGNYYIQINQNYPVNLLHLKSLSYQQGEQFRSFLLYPMVAGRLESLLSDDRINWKNYFYKDVNNEKSQLSFDNAELYLVDFWFLACAPCVSQHGEMKLHYEELKSANVEVISISIDKDYGKWNNYLIKNGYTWPNYLETGDKTITEDLVIANFPKYLIVDRHGKILESYNSFQEILEGIHKKTQ